MGLVARSDIIVPTPNGNVDGHFVDGNDGSTGIPLVWVQPPSLINIQQGSVQTFDESVYLIQPTPHTSTYSVLSGALSAGWTLNASTGVLTYSGSGIGSATIRLRASRAGVTADSPQFQISSIAAQTTDTVAPTYPTGLTGTQSAAAAAHLQVDAPCDTQYGTVNASGLKEVRWFRNASLIGTTPAPSNGVSLALTGIDLGSTPTAGSSVQTNASYVMTGSGTQVGGTTDDGQYALVPFTGDFTHTIKITSITGTASATAITGITVRDAQTANARALIAFRSAATMRVRTRTTVGGATSASGTVPTFALPCYWQVQRVAATNTFTVRYSADGNIWTSMGDFVVPMTTLVYVGQFVCGGVAGTNTAVATMDNVCLQNLPILEYTDTTVTQGSTYTYTAVARDNANNDSTVSPGISVTIVSSADTTPPTVPGTPVVTAGSDAILNLSWAASMDVAGVAGYNVFRSSSPVGLFTKLNMNLVTGTAYSDAAGLAAATTYYYTVSAVDASINANESAQSSVGSGTTNVAPGVDGTPPSVPTPVSSTAISTTVNRISHGASTDLSGVQLYKVYTSALATGPFVENATLRHTGLTVDDVGLSPGQTKYYTVSAVDASVSANESAQSTVAQGTTLLTAPTTTLLRLVDFAGNAFGSGIVTVGDVSIVTSPIRRNGGGTRPGSAYSMRSYVNRNTSSIKKRAEIAGLFDTPTLFKPVWYGWSVFFDNPFPNSTSTTFWEIIAQWHPDNNLHPLSNPSIFLSSYDNHGHPRLNLEVLGDSRALGTDGQPLGSKNGGYETLQIFNLTPPTPGKWMDFVMRVTFDYRKIPAQGGVGIGHTEFWVNGVKYVDFVGQNCLTASTGPYMKVGEYKGWDLAGSDNLTERQFHHGEIAIQYESAGASFATVDPATGVGPIP